MSLSPKNKNIVTTYDMMGHETWHVLHKMKSTRYDVCHSSACFAGVKMDKVTDVTDVV